MAKADSIQRLIRVAHRINARPYSTIEELEEWLKEELRRNGYATACSPNTIKRDILSLRCDFAIDIKFSRARGGYYIDKSDYDYNHSLSLIETFDTLAVIGSKGVTPNFVHLEAFKPKGTQYLHAIIEAIETRQTIEFDYYKYPNNTEECTARALSPYAIKQMNGRWYVIGREHHQMERNNNQSDDKNPLIKTFGLDRICKLNPSSKKFQPATDFSMDEKFAHSFGIYSGDKFPVEEVILAFDAEDGGYLKSVPLHPSQEILVDTPLEFIIKLQIRISFDFIMEILSRSNSLRVVAPESLRTKICDIYRRALKRNRG